MLVYFMDILYILRQYGICIYFKAIWHILWSFGIFPPFLVCFTMKNQAKLVYTKALLNQIAFPVNQTIVYSCRYDSLDLLLSTILEK
jgi:hypothetical protein